MDRDDIYVPRRTSRSSHFEIRGLRCHVRTWGDPGLATPSCPPLVLLHGWMDVGASFQFIVDELARLEGERRCAVAVDWRGFGGSASGGADSFWFPDYFGDLDALLDLLAPGQAVDLVGHSMGGNVAMVYAGVRPARVRRLVNMEGFGLADTQAEQAPDRLVKWLDQLKAPMSLASYDTLDGVAGRLRKNNPRLPPDRARWLAAHWAARREDGRWHILGEPAHKRVNPVPYRAAEAVAAWRRIEAPVLWMEGAQTEIVRAWGTRYTREEIESRLAQVPHAERVTIEDAGHMLHHDQPAECARAIIRFL